MKCNEFYGLISSYLEFELNEEQQESFEQHRRVCENCSKDLEDLTKVINALQSIPEEELPVDFGQTLRKRLINEAGAKRPGIIDYVRKNAKIVTSLAAGLIIVGCVATLISNGIIGVGSKKESTTSQKALVNSDKNTEDEMAYDSGESYNDKVDESKDTKPDTSIKKDEEKNKSATVTIAPEVSKEAVKGALPDKKEDVKINATAKKETPVSAKEPEVKKPKQEEKRVAVVEPQNAPVNEESFAAKVVADASQTVAATVTKASTPVEGTVFKQNVSHVFITRGSYNSAVSLAQSAGGDLVGSGSQIAVDPVVTLPLDAEVSTMVIKIPNNKFNSLVSAFASGLSSGEYEFGGIISSDISKKVLALKNQRDGLDNSILESGNIMDKNIFNSLNSQRDKVDSDLGNIIGNTGYTLVSILIRN